MKVEHQREARLERLEAFVGEWRLEAPAFALPPEVADTARATFEWTLGGAFLLQRASAPPPAPDGLCLIGPDAGDGYTQHYFDSRGVARLYTMTSDGRNWTLERHAPDFSPVAGSRHPTVGTGSSTSSSRTGEIDREGSSWSD